jgi:hypothetical protein
MINNLDAALKYLKNGYSVIALYSPSMLKRNASPKWSQDLHKALEENKALTNPLPEEEIIKKRVVDKCKRPAVASWTQFQKRLPTEAEVRGWFTQNPDANIGIITGKISNLCVFDLDSDDAQKYAEDQGGFPLTVKALSSKGPHYYMTYPDFEVRLSVNQKLKIDIRAEGGYIVAPPSIHGSGVAYTWDEDLSLLNFNTATCTPWMIDFLKKASKKNESEKKGSKNKKTAVATTTTPAKNYYAELLKNGCSEGSRNDSSIRLVGHLFGKGLDAEEVWELIRDWNHTKNTPPLDESDLREMVNSIKKHESHKPKKNKDKKQDKDITIASLLETPDQILADYDESYVRVPFAGNNLKIIEQKMNGGLVGGRFYVLGGIPSACKTMLANNIADNICLNGHPVLFFSFDDGKSELRYRTWARFSKTSIEAFNKKELDKASIRKICDQSRVKKIMSLKYVVQEMITVDKWDKLIGQFIDQHKKTPVIIIDYLRKLKTKKDSSDERMRVDNVLNLLTDMAKKYNTPIVAISELARDSYKGGQRLSMASFKESGSIEYQASWLGILSCVEEINGEYKLKNNWEKIIEQDGNVDLIIFKAKKGTGSTGKIPLSMDKNRMFVKDREDKNSIDTFILPKTKSMFSPRS